MLELIKFWKFEDKRATDNKKYNEKNIWKQLE